MVSEASSLSTPGEGISFKQEMRKRTEWAVHVCSDNQPIFLFPVQSLLCHPVEKRGQRPKLQTVRYVG